MQTVLTSHQKYSALLPETQLENVTTLHSKCTVHSCKFFPTYINKYPLSCHKHCWNNVLSHQKYQVFTDKLSEDLVKNIFFCHHNCPNMSLKVTRIPAVPLKHPAGKCPSVTLKTSSRFMSSSANTGRPLSCQHRLCQLVLSDVIWHTEMLIW